MRVVVDTNVLVSAVLSPAGKPAQVIDFVFTRRIVMLVTLPILAEYAEVLQRKEFGFSEKTILEFLRILALHSQRVAASSQSSVKPLPDSLDQPFLDCALEGSAEFLITGNKKHFPARVCHPVRIVSPKEFLELV